MKNASQIPFEFQEPAEAGQNAGVGVRIKSLKRGADQVAKEKQTAENKPAQETLFGSAFPEVPADESKDSKHPSQQTEIAGTEPGTLTNAITESVPSVAEEPALVNATARPLITEQSVSGVTAAETPVDAESISAVGTVGHIVAEVPAEDLPSAPDLFPTTHIEVPAPKQEEYEEPVESLEQLGSEETGEGTAQATSGQLTESAAPSGDVVNHELTDSPIIIDYTEDLSTTDITDTESAGIEYTDELVLANSSDELTLDVDAPIAGPDEPPLTTKPAKSNRGRKSLKTIDEAADLINIPPDEQLFQKQYYAIGEVAEMFHVNQSLLRFWETEFDIIQPRKNRKGDRHFRPVDIKNLLLIHDLLRRRKLTIEGAKDFLKKNKRSPERFAMIQSLQRIKGFMLEIKATL